MNTLSITAQAHPNIALIKYWGNQDDRLRLPSNGSISMNLANLQTTTKVEIASLQECDRLELNGEMQSGPSLERVIQYFEMVRKMFRKDQFLNIKSNSNFPIAAGIASSASAFAALAAAVSSIFELDLSVDQLSALARLGSGSACRSIPNGFTEWKTGKTHESSFAFSIAPVNHWDLWDCIAVVQSSPKDISSTQGHHSARTSPLQDARVKDTPRRLEICRKAIIDKDFVALADMVELDSTMMHAVMMTSKPKIMYWQPTSINIMREITNLRRHGVPALYTLDAGSNVHVICEADSVKIVEKRLSEIEGVERTIKSPVGNGTRLIN